MQKGVDHQRERFFIVCAGRTGSTLLASALADAGAEFGLPIPDSWHPGTGDMEHPLIQKSARQFYSAYRMGPEKPLGMVPALVWDARRHQAKKYLAQALEAAKFVKAFHLDLAVQPAFQLGYFPRIILNYRRFENQARSLFVRRGHSSVDVLADIYNRIYANGLMLLQIYGGCAISFEDMTAGEIDPVAKALADVTGLPGSDIARALNKRAKSGPAPDGIETVMNERADALYRTLEKIKAKVVSPSPQAIRSWHNRYPNQNPGKH